jgi:hypothetical protein
LTTGVESQNEELLTKNKSQRVTPLLAQRITLTGNSYFWRTALSALPDIVNAIDRCEWNAANLRGKWQAK